MRKHILVVDNDPDVLQLLEAVLDSEGYDVDTRSSPDEALPALRSDGPDLLIADVMMPTMTGIDLLKQGRSQGFQGRCLMISGLSTKAVGGAAMSNGADAILPKPMDLGDLLAFVRHLLSDPAPSLPPLAVPLTVTGACG
jgi:DNA-binding response OmpR family regulator